jgi:hypothetical protein
VDISNQGAIAPSDNGGIYSHAAFTIRQHMFSPRGSNGAPPVILFEFASVRPMKITFSFTPVVERMWPAPTFGRPSAEWVKDGGYYVLHTDSPALAAAVAVPRAQPGILQPYQERPLFYPVQFQLNFDPARDSNLFFPMLLAVGKERDNFGAELASLNHDIPQLYASTQEHYRQLLSHSLQVESPDTVLNQALEWAIVSIDQMQVKYGDELFFVGRFSTSRFRLVFWARHHVDSVCGELLWRFRADQARTRFSICAAAVRRKNDARVFADGRPGRLEEPAVLVRISRCNAAIDYGDGRLCFR